MSTLPHTAICTWSGFVYQGKVSLLHSLQVICDEGSAIAKDYQLQLDSLDDFAILNADNTAKSLHQVKALKSSYFSTYEGAFKKQQELLPENQEAKFFFHVAVPIRDKTAESIVKDYSPVELYNYSSEEPQKYYCSLDDIDQQIEARLKLYFIKEKSTESFRKTPEYLMKCRRFLDQIIQGQVIEIHAAVHDGTAETLAASEKTIPFNCLLDVLEKDLTQDGMDEEYFYWVLKQDLGRYYQEFCIDYEIIERDMGEKLSKYMYQINQLDIHSLKIFLRSILPHRKVKMGSLIEYKDETFHKEEMKDALFCILQALKESQSSNDNLFYWNDGAGTSYAPTAIHAGSTQGEKTCERIIKNTLDQDVILPFEVDKLITIDIECDSVSKTANHILTPQDEGESNYDRITNWKDISLIKLENAKEKIND